MLGCFDIGETAKILNISNIGRTTLFKKLRESGIFMKGNNLPLQRYINKGYFLVKQKRIEKYPYLYHKVYVTQKGLDFLNEHLKKQDQ